MTAHIIGDFEGNIVNLGMQRLLRKNRFWNAAYFGFFPK